ncbi:MSMEG_0565 family glycosyltransferase [Leekyejoonella antrihumi]|uniref:MSMEG_0565 family glycosyltransferase n=1 Tax=Leekyejoonella antrihumi TaxID=1660198 RepID=A0A563E740_9MICO|nr:MSMEG_0565 family glycosyltransferase [Leekyejoonella antrihumi]TWP38031.1 MSMEG_0565 family glycosyltransferase [Leekyejoonella antrihumi]
MNLPRVALVSYSTRPRGGMVHTLSLADALVARHDPVRVVALDRRPSIGFFRAVSAPTMLIPGPAPLPTLEERVFASVDALEAGLHDVAEDVDVLHAQDCISARAAARVRDAGAPVVVVRTVHHVDDFTTAALIDCQQQAISEPDRLIVVSDDWRRRLAREYGVAATVIHNGVDSARFGPIDPTTRTQLREAAGVADRFVFLAVGGIEPRKGTACLFRALAQVRDHGRRPALVIVGGHSFQDYTDYRDKALAQLDEFGLALGSDVIQVGTVSDETLHHWYRSADALAFPSLKEGWGLAVLEALSAELPTVTSDIPVLREYLTDGVTAVLTRADDPTDLARGMRSLMDDPPLRSRLASDGLALAHRFTWAQAAAEHERLYRSLRG